MTGVFAAVTRRWQAVQDIEGEPYTWSIYIEGQRYVTDPLMVGLGRLMAKHLVDTHNYWLEKVHPDHNRKDWFEWLEGQEK
jgi:hypothetical protein